MSSLRHRVAKLAVESKGTFRSRLLAALRVAEEETDTEGKFEKGKRVPLSELPEELQENVEDPPAGVTELREKMKGKTATLGPKVLDHLVQMEAETYDLPNTRGAKATPEVHAAANKFTRAVSNALAVFAQRFPPAGGATVGDMMAAEGAYVVFMSLDGHAVNMSAGPWARYYDDTKPLERFLTRAVAREHQALKSVLETAAHETAGGQ